MAALKPEGRKCRDCLNEQTGNPYQRLAKGYAGLKTERQTFSAAIPHP
jgi:hypothetical protein